MQHFVIPFAVLAIEEDAVKVSENHLRNIGSCDLARGHIGLFRLQFKGNAVNVVFPLDEIGKGTQPQPDLTRDNSII